MSDRVVADTRIRIFLSVIIFLIIAAITLFSLAYNRQLGGMGGMAEEYFELGLNLQQKGEFYPEVDAPFVFRPPGYSVFIAGVLSVWNVFSSHEPVQQILISENNSACTAVYFAQCLLLGLSAGILFFWLSTYLKWVNAFAAALLFGANPYMILLTGLLHYEILHTFFVIISCCLLSSALHSARLSAFKILISGIFWGLTTLIRPMTLILPFFMMVMAGIKYKLSLNPALRATAIFVIGMTLAISPYTLRNYSLTKRFIPVCSQGGFALWAGSVMKLPVTPNYYRWCDVWVNHGEKVFSDLVPLGVFDYKVLIEYNNVLDDAYGKEAKKNIFTHPDVYLYNCINSFRTFNLDINSVFIKSFLYIQTQGNVFHQLFLYPGNPQDFYPDAAANLFKYFIYLLTLFSFAGIIFALVNKEEFLIVPVFAYLCFATAHSITYMDIMYYYIKVPFLFVFAWYFINALNRYGLHLPFIKKRVGLDYIINGMMVLYGAGLMGKVIIGI